MFNLTFIEVIVIMIIVGIIAFIPMAFLFNFGLPNDGSHTGYITAVEREGIIWKTYTAYVKTNSQSSQEDKYCVDSSVVEELKKAQVENKQVTVNYKRGFTLPIWECSGESTEIISVK